MTDDELSASRSADNLLPSRKLSKQQLSDSALLNATQMSRNGKPLSLVNSSAVSSLEGKKGGGMASESKIKSSRGAESRTNMSIEDGKAVTSEPKKKTSKGSELRSGGNSKGSVSAIEEEISASSVAGSEAKRKSSKGTETSIRKKRNSLPDIEAQLEEVVTEPGKKKVMSPRSSSESNIVASSLKKKLPESSLKESRSPGRGADVNASSGSEGAVGGQRRALGELRRPSDSNLPRPDAPLSPDTPVGRLRSATTGHISPVSNRPSSAASARKKTIKLAPVARPISAQPSRAVRRMAEQKRLEEEREERERTAAAAKVVKKEESQTDGEVVVGGEVSEEQVEGEGTGREREGLWLKDTVRIPSANSTPTHKKSLPVRSYMLTYIYIM